MTPYDIVVDEARHRVDATLRGFWDAATLDAYVREFKAANARVSSGGKASWWLISIGAQVQSRDIAKAMGAQLEGILPPTANVAVLMGSGLSAMQVKRVVTDEHHRHFSALADAEQWLTEQGMPG